MKDRFALLTNDVETTSIWYNDFRDKTGEKVYKEGMPLLLETYRNFGIRTTFFFTAYIAKLIPDVVRMVLADRHEVGSHGKSHLTENGFDVMPFEKQIRHLDYSKKILEDISGQEVLSFRAPAIRVSPITARALLETGFRYDSSIASQRFDFFLSHGSKNKMKFLSTPRKPYRTKGDDIFKAGNSDLIEVPLSATIFPFIGSSMRMMPLITQWQQRILHLETKLTGKPAVFVIHPNELIDESQENRVISRRAKGFVSHILTDQIRARIKTKNLGPESIIHYKKLIRFYVDNGYAFTTVKEYAENLVTKGVI